MPYIPDVFPPVAVLQWETNAQTRSPPQPQVFLNPKPYTIIIPKALIKPYHSLIPEYAES